MLDAIKNRDVDCVVGVTVSAEEGGVLKSKEFIATKEALGLDVEPISYLLENPSHGLKLNLSGMEGFENVKLEAFVKDDTDPVVISHGGAATFNAAEAN